MSNVIWNGNNREARVWGNYKRPLEVQVKLIRDELIIFLILAVIFVCLFFSLGIEPLEILLPSIFWKSVRNTLT